MNRRPHSVTIIGWLFIAVGTIGFAYHVREFMRPFQYDTILVCLIRLAAIVGGAFVLRGRNWARWLLIIWMGYHVILSAFHSVAEVVMHAVLFGMIAYLLLRPRASAYFSACNAERAPDEKGKDPTAI